MGGFGIWPFPEGESFILHQFPEAHAVQAPRSNRRLLYPKTNGWYQTGLTTLGTLESRVVGVVEKATNPGAGDDSDDGYSEGFVWINTTASPRVMFVCTDDTVGAAVWIEVVSTVSLDTFTKVGKVLFVDSVYGDDSVAARESFIHRYLTIEAAIADALSGDTIYIFPGAYSLAAGITIPDGVAIRGINTNAVTIQMLGVTANTTLVTMGENTRLEDVALKLTSSGHHTLTGVKFGGTTSTTAKLRTAVVSVDNSGAGAGASDVTGILVQSTGVPDREIAAIRASMISVNSTGTGTKRGMLLNTSLSNFHIRDTNIVCRGSGGGSFIGMEVNFAGSRLGHYAGLVEGSTADVSQTAGTLELNATDLINSKANAKNFTAQAISFGLIWADESSLPGTVTRYYRPGTAQVSVSEVFIRIPRKAVVKSLSIRAASGPGGVRTDTWTVRKNGVDTILIASLTGAATSATNLMDSVDVVAGDSLSLKVLTAAGTSTSDSVISVEIY